MKKLFTLVAMALMAIGANAQTPFTDIKADEFTNLVNFEASVYNDAPSLSYTGAGEIGTFTLRGVDFQFKNSSNKDNFIRTSSDQGLVANGKNLIFTITTDNANEEVVVEVAAKGGTAPVFEIQEGTGTIGEVSATKGADGKYPVTTATLTSNADKKITVKETAAGYTFVSYKKTGTSSINGVVSVKADANAPIYNLAGQRVSKDAKGVLIQNGKKFIR